MQFAGVMAAVCNASGNYKTVRSTDDFIPRYKPPEIITPEQWLMTNQAGLPGM